MVKQVIKRDGRVKPFDGNKIIDAVSRAGNVDTATLYKIVAEISSVEQESLTVEEIQDIVEQKLMSSSYGQVAKDYIIYRNDRSRVRKHEDPLRKSIYKKLMAVDYDRQNANVDGKSFGGRKGEADSEMMKDIALYDIMSEMARNNHLNNEIYTHDLSDYPVGNHNCISIIFDKLLRLGFDTRQTDVRPANSVNTESQLVAVISQLQSLQQFGGVSATHLDHTMNPYVKKSFLKNILIFTSFECDCTEDEVEEELNNIFLEKYGKSIKDTYYDKSFDFIKALEDICCEVM